MRREGVWIAPVWEHFFTFDLSAAILVQSLDSMDSVISLLNADLSIWGVIAMPLGVALCFGPALLVWLKEELGTSEKHKDRE